MADEARVVKEGQPLSVWVRILLQELGKVEAGHRKVEHIKNTFQLLCVNKALFSTVKGLK
jgi:hypothetical protein